MKKQFGKPTRTALLFRILGLLQDLLMISLCSFLFYVYTVNIWSTTLK